MQQHLTAPQFFRSPHLLMIWIAVVTFAILVGTGCAPQIGDACETNDNCPSGAFCDRSVQSGFCTVDDCRPGNCPSESVCVEYERHDAYCMRSCESDGDCRDDHVCINDEERDKRYCFLDD